MSKKASPVVVGAFTFGALAVLVAILLIFGSNRFLRQTMDCVMYFEGSVSGLDVGAPVIFRGVKIGTVKEIRLVYDRAQSEFLIPVVVELYKGSATHVGGEQMVDADWLKELVAQGARAQLEAQSLVTGKQMISLDFHKDKPVHLAADTSDLPQIPTIPTTLQAFSSKVEALPLDDIVHDLRTTMQGISQLVNDPSTRALTTNLNAALVSMRGMIDALNAEFVPIAREISTTSKTARESLAEATVTLQKIQKSLDAESPLRYEVSKLIESTRTAARSIAELTAALERAPESIIRGKSVEERY